MTAVTDLFGPDLLDTVGGTILALLVLSGCAIPAARHPASRYLVYGGSLVLCGILLVAALCALETGVRRATLPLGLPWIGTHLRLDALSGFFLGLIGLGGAGASLFAMGDGRHEHHPQRVLPFYPAFLAAMALVVVADDAFLFLFAWELMSLTSWALVMAHQDQPETARAGLVYLLMATFSGLALLLAFSLLAGAAGSPGVLPADLAGGFAGNLAGGFQGSLAGSPVTGTGYAFDSIRAAPPSAGLAAAVFILALIGAGSKAGLAPLHVWLPLAHPAAPSHVSALMSGVMTKVAVYGFIRIAFDLLAPTPWWTASLVLALGGVTAVLGVLQATMERDLKRLLAYSTVENIGILFIALGLALAFRTNGFAAGAALAVTAALFHALNHTLFKSLLFFGAGSVLHATGTRDMEAMGGLIHRMPLTSFVFLVGCVAVSALPPLNGFASEWLTFQAMLLRPDMPQWGLKLMVPVDAALLALAAALAATCFVRAFGISFLGRPRSRPASGAHEADWLSLSAMMGFALLCLLAGIVPGAVIDSLSPVARALTGERMPVQLNDAWLTIAPIAASRSSYNGLLVFGFIAASICVTMVVVHRVSRGVRRSAAWDCGFPRYSRFPGDHGLLTDHVLLSDRGHLGDHDVLGDGGARGGSAADHGPATADSQYTAASFAQPLRRVFGSVVFNAHDAVDMPPPGDNRPARIVRHISDPVWDTIYLPLGAAIAWTAGRLNVLQFLTIRRYLGFVFGALVVLLLTLTLWQ